MRSDKRKHILVVSQYFYPEQFRINDMCKEWINRGYEITVITGIPNYPQGRFYRGYGWLKKRTEEYEGVHIVRLPLIARGNNSITLILNYFSFVVSGRIWSLFTKIKADKVFVFEVSPMTQALLGVWYAKRNHVPCLIYVQDLWPENVEVVTGIHNKRIIGAIDRMVDYIYSNCKYIFATSYSFVKRIEERKTVWKDGKSKVVYWPQYAEEFYKPLKPKALKEILDNDTFKIIFTGNIGYAQGLEILPKAAAILKREHTLCEFYIIGDGRYKKEFEGDILKNDVTEMFHLLGRKNPEEIPQYLANCNMAFLSFADNALFGMTIPAKLQSYMACGIPIIAAASGETREIIESSFSGYVSEIGNASQLAGNIKKAIQEPQETISEMGKNALKYYQKEFTKKELLDKMETYFI